MIKAVINALVGWRGYALVSAVSVLVGLGSMYWVGDLVAKASELKRAQAALISAHETIRYVDRAGAVTTKIEYRYAQRAAEIRTVTQTVIQEVPVYVTAQADRDCTVPVGFVRLFNAAAAGTPVPEPAGSANDAPSGVALSAVAAATVDNSGAYHEVAARLTALQDWIRDQKALADSPPAKAGAKP